MSFEIGDTGYICTEKNALEVVITEGQDRGGVYMVLVLVDDAYDLPVHHSDIFANRDACIDHKVKELNEQISNFESQRLAKHFGTPAI